LRLYQIINFIGPKNHNQYSTGKNYE